MTEFAFSPQRYFLQQSEFSFPIFQTTKSKKFIRLSPGSSSKKRHSKHREPDSEVEIDHCGSGTSMAKKSEQRLKNGPTDKDIQGRFSVTFHLMFVHNVRCEKTGLRGIRAAHP